jgi:hypothetical protein
MGCSRAIFMGIIVDFLTAADFCDSVFVPAQTTAWGASDKLPWIAGVAAK